MGAAFQIRKGEKEFLGPRRGAGLWPPNGGAKSPEGDGPYGSPPGPYFSMKKSRQKSLGECPETPDASVHPVKLGPPQGRKTLWGKEDAPQRGGLPEAKRRVSPT